MRKLPEIEVREGAMRDLAGLMTVADEFFNYGGTDANDYCRETFLNSAIGFLNGIEGTKIFMAEHEEEIVGYYALAYNRVYSKRPIMYEAHFAVLKGFVLSTAGRDLTRASIKFGEDIKALCFYAGATSGIKRFDNSLINLYSKLNFKPSGAMMRYDYGKI